MKTTVQICRCNECDIYMEDLNPSEESKEFSDKEIEATAGLNLLPMERHETEHYVVCPICKADGSLADITDADEIKVSLKRVALEGYGFTEETMSTKRIGFYNLEEILDHNAWNPQYHNVRHHGQIRVAGYQYDVAPLLKQFCVMDLESNLFFIHDTNKENALDSFSSKVSFIVEVKDEHYYR